MASHTQQLVWTPLPRGFTPDRRRLRLTALLSPRLVVSPGPDDDLVAFPDMLAWPAILRAARFDVEFAGGAARGTPVSDLDDDVRARLFHKKTAVRSRSFEDRRGHAVLAFPVADVERDLADIYGRLAVEADGELPLLERMRLRFAPLGHEMVRGRHTSPLDEFRQRRRERPQSPAERLNLVDLYNTPLAAPRIDRYTRRGPDDPREDSTWETYQTVPLPDPQSFRRSFDFHQIVAALAQYPLLLRLTGLAVDLEVPRDRFPAGPQSGPVRIVVTWASRPETAALGVSVLPDVGTQTVAQLDDGRFEPAPSNPSNPSLLDGYLVLAGRGFDVTQVDVNGSALKLRHFAVNMAQMPSMESEKREEVDPAGVPPARTGTPALRSGGLTLSLRQRGLELEGKFASAGAMEDAMRGGAPVVLHQEDLVRGYHVEVRDEVSAEWRSLCRRDSEYTFLADQTTLNSDDNEGMVRLGASGSSDGSNPDILKLHEGLFTWSGWSLVAPPLGRAVKKDDKVGDAESVAPPGLPLEVDHRVRARSLPSLRYGRRYTMRLRVADLAGNALPFDPARASGRGTQTEPVEYLRYEPIEAPAIALVGPAAAAAFPGPGEDLLTAAIHSLNAAPEDNAVNTNETAQRYVVPPVTSQRQAEHHGALDAGGRIDPATYAMLVDRDGSLPEAVHPMTSKSFPTSPVGFSLPFLPDPLARDCVLRVSGRAAVGSLEVIRIPWYAGGASWPDAQPFRIEILEVDDAANVPPRFDQDDRVLRLPLAKADRIRVRIGHTLTDEALRLLGLWRWASAHMPADPAARRKLLEMAAGGEHWMLTPWRDIELVHAVQKPLIVPAIEDLAIWRSSGSTIAQLAFATRIDSRSTEKLDLVGRWLDPVDDVADPGPRAQVGGGDRAAELKLARLEAPGVNPPGRRTWTARQPVEHAFADTRYRRVGYRLTATTRFKQFLPEALRDPARAEDLTVTSDEAIGFVPNSAAPPAPDVVYVIPTFGWSRSPDGRHERSWRDGGGLRVYLRRPWLVTGYMEMLGVVLPRTGERSAEPAMARFVTQWGADPTWRAGAVQGAAPPLSRFALAVTAGPIPQSRLAPVIPDREGDLPAGNFRTTGLPLPGVPDSPLVDVVPHLVGWDPDRRLWYADIVVDPGSAYTPFIRLALSRYQPISAPGCHISPVATTEVVQLFPDRLAVITRTERRSYRVGLFGHAPRQRFRPIEFVAERLPAGASPDFGWEPLADAAVSDAPAATPEAPAPGGADRDRLLIEARGLLTSRRFDELLKRPDLLALVRPPVIREVEIQLARDREEGERFRLVITELELRSADPEHVDPPPAPDRDPRRRVVYMEVVELN